MVEKAKVVVACKCHDLGLCQNLYKFCIRKRMRDLSLYVSRELAVEREIAVKLFFKFDPIFIEAFRSAHVKHETRAA